MPAACYHLQHNPPPTHPPLPPQTDLSNPWAQFDLAASMLFLFDVWMNFRTAYIGVLSSMMASSFSG
jgi:hypothetical protein